MPAKKQRKFYFGIVLPTVLAIALYIISIFVIIIPSFEKSMMDRKKEMIKELTNAAWSILDEYNILAEDDSLNLNEAKKKASFEIGLMRYGEERKDYFWIIDLEPRMVMHPYRKDLNGKPLEDYSDPEGKRLFVKAVETVQENHDGYISYIWQWKDDSTLLVPKLSYVKLFEDWGWIIGTGIYLEDVADEIKALQANLLWVSFVIILIISIALFFVVRQSLQIENERIEAEKGLRLSRQKYKSLVEASTEGTLMIINNKIIFANQKFLHLLNCPEVNILDLGFEDMFDISWHEVVSKFTAPDKSINLETSIKCKGDIRKEVVISVSQVKHASNNGYIVVAQNVTKQKRLDIESMGLVNELQTTLLLMNQPIRQYVQELIKIDANSNVEEVAKLMSRKNSDVVFIEQNGIIIGVINSFDLNERVLARGLNISTRAIEVMTSPVISVSEKSLLYEVILLFRENNISHLLVKGLNNENVGCISYTDMLAIQQNSVGYIIQEIKQTESIGALKKINERVPVLIKALLESGEKTQNITQIITSVSDAITYRVVELAIEKFGTPPCKFAFVVLGSEARKEQSLLTDQDNAIIFEDDCDTDTDKIYSWFTNMAKWINTNLDNIGYKLCKGDIMAGNPKWCQPIGVWKEYFSEWIQNSDPQNVLDTCIFFDFRYVYGDINLVAELKHFIDNFSDNRAVFLQHMSTPIIRQKLPVSMFGNIVGTNKESKLINVKHLLLPIVGFSRIYALKEKLNDVNTLERIEKLFSNEVISCQLYDELKFSYNYLMHLRFQHQVKSLDNYKEPNNLVNIENLNTIQKTTLKKVISEIGNIQTQLSFEFKGQA